MKKDGTRISEKWTKDFYDTQLTMLKPMFFKKLNQYIDYAKGQKDEKTVADLIQIKSIIMDIYNRSNIYAKR